MTDICPCCKRPLDKLASDLVVSLDWQTATRRGVMVDMQPQSAVLLHTLNRCWPLPAIYDRLFMALYGQIEPRSDNPTLSLRVQISRLRRIVAPLKMKIHNDHSVGYRLELL